MTDMVRKRSVSPLALVLILAAVFFVVFVLLAGFLVLRNGPQSYETESDSSAIFSSVGQGEAVGVIELNGVINDSKKILRQLKNFEENKRIGAIVLRLNSPGGAVAPSQEIFEAVKSYKKPLVVSMASVAASGAFYIACGAKKVYANAGTLTGSIGVIMMFTNMQKLYQWAKVDIFALKSGKFKDSGSPYREMKEEDRALLQATIDDVHVQFKKAVAEGRKMKPAELERWADGRVMTGQQAKNVGLVDAIGTIADAIKEAGTLAGIKGEPKVLYPKSKARWLDLIREDEEEAEGSESLMGRLFHSLGKLENRIALETTPGLYWLWDGTR